MNPLTGIAVGSGDSEAVGERIRALRDEPPFGESVEGPRRQSIEAPGVALGAEDCFLAEDGVLVALEGEVSSDEDRDPRRGAQVVAEVYRRRGTTGLQHLSGSYTLALYDPTASRLVLARDRWGSRPLYWSEAGGCIVFSSSLRQVLTARGTPPAPDLLSVHQALAIGWVPSPRTGFLAVQKLPAAGLLESVRGRIETRHSWHLGSIEGGIDSAEQQARRQLSLEGRLRDEIRRQLRGRRRPGLFLSGGLDSSYLALLAAEEWPEPLTTLTAYFPNEPQLDEREPARQVAMRAKSDHHEIELRTEELMALLDRTIAINEEPWSASPSSVVAALAGAARDAGLDLVMTGDGADTLFAGERQSWSHQIALTLLRRLVPPALAESRARHVAHQVSRNRWLALAAPDDHAAELEGSRRLTRAERESLLRSDHVAPASVRAIDAARLPEGVLSRCQGSFDRRAALDLFRRVAECLTPESHKQLAHVGLSLATPYLADQVVEAVLALPRRERLRPGSSKRVLRRLAADRVPDSVLTRRKLGLQYPPSLLAAMRRGLLEEASKGGLYDPDGLQKWLADPAVIRREWRSLVTVYTVGRWWAIHFS